MADKNVQLVFGSLKEGIHEFEYQLNQSFFADFEQEIITNGDVHVLLNLERSERHLSLGFKLKGWVEKQCDVCLSELQFPVESEQNLHVKITDKLADDEADLIYLPGNEYQMDLGAHLFDYVALALPMKIECKDSLNREECDEKILEMLTTTDETDANASHPEWQKLKEIFKN